MAATEPSARATTDSASSTENGPRNAVSWLRASRSTGSSSSQDPARVWSRGVVSRWRRRSSIWAALSTVLRPAASSRARGRASRRRTSVRTSSSSALQDGRAIRARAEKRSTAASSSRGPSSRTCSPSTRSRSRLVVRMRSSGAAASQAEMAADAPRTTCSRLSRISRRGPALARTPGRRSIAETPSVDATALRTSSSSRASARGQSQTGRRCAAFQAAPARTASRVLPAPPGPTTVTRRAMPRRSATSSSSRCRPRKGVDPAGRLCGADGGELGGVGAGASSTSWKPIPGTVTRWTGVLGSRSSLRRSRWTA